MFCLKPVLSQNIVEINKKTFELFIKKRNLKLVK